MPQIVQIKSPVFAAVTDKTGYVKARKEADTLASKYGLRVADMPMTIQAMANHPDFGMMFFMTQTSQHQSIGEDFSCQALQLF